MKRKFRSISFGSKQILFEIRHSKKRKTVSIFVDPVEGVYIRAPWSIKRSIIEKIVHAKARWILEKQNKIKEIEQVNKKKEFVSGEALLYLGRQYRLKLEKRKPEVAQRAGYFIVGMQYKNGKESKKKVIRKNLIKWYKIHAKTILSQRMKLYAKKIKLEEPKIIIISTYAKRWGSCSSKGVVRFNWHIIMAPMTLIDYVVVHELCHLKYKNHSSDFWKYLGTILSDYEIRRERLRKEGSKYYL